MKGKKKLYSMALASVAVILFLILVSSTAAAAQSASSVKAYAYITNSGDNTVSVIDISKNTVVATVPVGLEPTGVASVLMGKGCMWQAGTMSLQLTQPQTM